VDVFRRVVFVAIVAGLATGGLIAIAHHVGTARLIAQAEVYEQADEKQAPAVPAVAMPDMQHHEEAAAWAPADGLERSLFSVLADVVTAIAFALLLAAAQTLRGATGVRTGLLWGLAGFVTFTLAPGIGLPPEVPGTAAAALADRQLWFAATAAATGAALALIFLQQRPLWAMVAIVLLILPHAWGAPLPTEFHSAAPPELAHRFAVVATLTSLVLWTLLGIITGALLHRFEHAGRPAPAQRPAG
jgi:cobalt transporter subunit CbtA